MSYISVAELRAYLDIQETTTFTASASTDLLTLASVEFMNALTTGTEVEVSTTTTLPGGLSASTVYYVHTIVDQTCALATTSALATAGTKIDLTSAGSGTHTITRSNADTDLLTDSITAAQAYIEAQTNRVFEATTETRYYDDSALDRWNGRLLNLFSDDLLTVTTLTNGDSSGTEIDTGDYWLVPRNEGPPYHGILLKSDIDDYWQWDTDYWVSVAGTWGYSTTVPGDIKQATKVLAAFAYRAKDASVFETTAIVESGAIAIPQGIPAYVDRVLTFYKRRI